MKRETGASPVQTRYCNYGVQKINTCVSKDTVTDKIGKAFFCAMIFKSGDLPAVGTRNYAVILKFQSNLEITA